MEFKKLGWNNWNLAGYTGSKNQVRNGQGNQVRPTWFFKLGFSKSADQFGKFDCSVNF